MVFRSDGKGTNGSIGLMIPTLLLRGLEVHTLAAGLGVWTGSTYDV
jgi:hypothetical protein